MNTWKFFWEILKSVGKIMSPVKFMKIQKNQLKGHKMY